MTLAVRISEVVELFLEHHDHLGIPWTARAPAGQHVVPGDGLLEVPALRLRIELARERVIELPHVVAIAGCLMSGDRDADLLAVRHDCREPPLAQLVVGEALEPVFELGRMHLLVVGEPKPLHAQREHPVDRALQLVLRRATRSADPLHPGAAVAEVEVFLEHHLVQTPLPRAVRALVVDVAEEAEAGLVVEAVRDHELGPAVEGHVERVRIAEALRIAAEDELLLVLAELLEDVVRDVSVRELVLDDRDAGHEGVDAWRALGGEVVGGGGDELGVAGNYNSGIDVFPRFGGSYTGSPYHTPGCTRSS